MSEVQGTAHRCCNTPGALAFLFRYIYNRHNQRDGDVVPYHPAVLLAWGAHVNIQRVTNTSWSFYILKYAGEGSRQDCLGMCPCAVPLLTRLPHRACRMALSYNLL